VGGVWSIAPPSGAHPASFGGAKELVTRAQLTAADAAVSIGTGPEVTGSAVSLLLAVSGRSMALDDPTDVYPSRLPRVLAFASRRRATWQR
jgi:hypothetical protein